MTISDVKYQCVAGETFDSIALMVFKNERYAADIMNVNPLLCCVPMFNGGEVLNLPVINNNDDYIKNNAPWKEE